MSRQFTPEYRGGSGPPLVLIHGFTDTWRTWELVIPTLEKSFDVLAVTLPGHAGGPAGPDTYTPETLPDGVAKAMDKAGFEAAHLVGNSLGGFVALQLAARGRALSVTGLAPAGGWSPEFQNQYALDYFITQQALVKKAAAFADQIAATPEGRRQATRFIVEDDSLITAGMVVHQLVGAASCPGAQPMIELARREGFELDAEAITCAVRLIWGTEDKLLRWPDTAVRFREEWLPTAEFIELEGVGHCPQLEVPVEVAALISGTAALA
ncbi:MAG: alpha/beta hydrolase [Solirubrobacterales bacterium]|jgi:pimeloyl-ACP methyl ester carboxylesterase|nr:alpha/beta hydrolase [Solirubrobacterales bacterium]